MDIQIKPFGTLSHVELYALLRLRSEVFVVEQQCVYQDIDDRDAEALHLLVEEDGDLAAYLRIFQPEKGGSKASIGRVVVASSHRKKGLARRMMQHALEFISLHFKVDGVFLSAQVYLKDFYADLGFEEQGEPYLEDGIPHIKMVRA